MSTSTTANPPTLNAGNHGLTSASFATKLAAVVVAVPAPSAGAFVETGGSVGSWSGVVVVCGIVVVVRLVVDDAGAPVVAGAPVGGGAVGGGGEVVTGGGSVVCGDVGTVTCAPAGAADASRNRANTRVL